MQKNVVGRPGNITIPSLREGIGQWCIDHKRGFFALLSLCWIALLYWHVLQGPFVYDDLDHIPNNPALRSWNSTFARFLSSPVAFSSEYRNGMAGSTFRPVFWLSLFVDLKLWGTDSAIGFHFTNLVLHWINGILLFALFLRAAIPGRIAAVSIVLWLSLPTNTEVVAWISARSYLLCCLFVLLGLLATCSYLHSGKRSRLIYLFGCAMAAGLCHEEGGLLILIVLLFAYVEDQSQRLVKIVVTLGLADIFLLIIAWSVGVRTGRGPLQLWSTGLIFWKYVQWMVIPIHLSVERSTSIPANSGSPGAIVAWLAFLSLIFAGWVLRKRMPIVAGGLAASIFLLLPFCGFVYIYQGMAERFAYLASIGFILSITAFSLGYNSRWRPALASCILLWAVWGGWRARMRALDWTDPIALFESSLEATPRSSVLYANLGYLYRQRGELAKAVVAYNHAIELQPRDEEAFVGLGVTYSGLGRLKEAVESYRRAIALRDDDNKAILDLAVALGELGDSKGAEEEFRKAMTLSPRDESIYLDLGGLLFQSGRVDEAIKCYQKAIELAPADIDPYYDLGILFQKRGQIDMALAFYKKAIELKPKDPDTLRNLTQIMKNYYSHHRYK